MSDMNQQPSKKEKGFWMLKPNKFHNVVAQHFKQKWKTAAAVDDLFSSIKGETLHTNLAVLW